MKKKEKKQRPKPTTTWGKAWDYFWHGDSWGSWILNIIVAFLLIQFVVYPLLGLFFGTGLPVVAVVSGSMEHDGHFDEWWNSTAFCNPGEPCTQADWYNASGISKEEFKTYSFKNGFNKGDLILLKGIDPQEVEIGDVIVFDIVANKARLPVIHRVVSITPNETVNESYMYATKGDHNAFQLANTVVNETHISYEALRGKAFGRIPFVGYLKLAVVDFFTLFSGKHTTSAPELVVS